MLKLKKVKVFADGEIVNLKIGNVQLKLGYEDALSLSQWIRVRAKEAKNNAGDTSRNWRLMGYLTDANRTEG